MIELTWTNKKEHNEISLETEYKLELIQKVTSKQQKLTNHNNTNKIIYGDNLETLKILYSDYKNKIKLIYIDPPYNTGRVFKNKEGVVCYTDKYRIEDYCNFIYQRLYLMRELLSDDGSIYVHCDYHTNSYIRLILDELFGKENFRNEIIWVYSGAGKCSKDFPRKHDTILRYSKSDNYIFNKDDIRVEYNEETKKRVKRNVHKGFLKELKLNPNGKIPEDWWNIPIAGRYVIDGINRTGYPTEKPLNLLERIIKASSNENDLIVDFFAGSGATLVVAEKLNRKWIGVDNSPQSIETIKNRLQDANSQFNYYEITVK